MAAEKVFEEILKEFSSRNNNEDEMQCFNKLLLEKFQKSSTTTSSCTLEEFAIFYFGMVKSQTDEFIKSNTSTCNTPHKINFNNAETANINVVDASFHDNNKKIIATENVGGGELSSSSSLLLQQQRVSDGNKSSSGGGGKGEMRFTKRQISRELFVNPDGGSNQCDSDNNNSRVNESKGRINLNKSGGGGRNYRKIFAESSTSFAEIESVSCELPTSTSTPNYSKNSLSLEQSSMMNRGNSSRKSFDISSGNKNNNSINRRNTSSPFCLADFINTSSSNKGSKKKNHSNTAVSSTPTIDTTPKFSTIDFPSLNQGSTATAAAAASAGKPKKRVMPITVSRKASIDTPNFISSSFQSENNLLNVTTLEADSESLLVPEREILREHRDAISKDFHNEHKPMRNLHAIIKENLPASPQQQSAMQISSTPHKSALEYDEMKVDRQDVLIVMAKIYSFLIDANHVPNILSEFSYIVNLLNTEHNPYEHQSQNHIQMKTFVDIAAHLLKNYHNCIFFAICVLNHQKQILAMLDCTTIRVICDYERIRIITPALYEYLRNVMQKKIQMDTLMSSHKAGRSDANDINKVVFFQQDTDNRDNFPSDREFGAFKKQRDMFYAILRSWELKHLDPSWDFRKDLGAKVRSLLTLLEHPINMAHLAKLFTAQLIISCNFDNELQMALPNIDLSKLSKLRQRLVAPSLFSTQYLFPGNQAFFRDFIICCDFHMMFIEQLKIALISELLQMNDSSMETLSVARGNGNNTAAAAAADDDSNKENSFRQEFIVRAENISTMRVIGKFIGFVVSRSYSYDGYRNSLVDQKQLSIRNLIHPDFDVKSIVMRAIDDRKLLVTIPWLVEYLSMLDFITIRLDYYRELFRILYTIYMSIKVIDGHNDDGCGFCIMSQSKFIVRTCLGWLFEHPSVPEDYYNSNMMLINFHCKSSSNCVATMTSSTTTPAAATTIDELNPHLESIIHTACPFLADFRVSMMPQRNRMTKAVSRTGRYRHVTTKMQDKVSIVSGGGSGSSKTQGNHERLIEAFLTSQSLSVRKIVDFTIDRVSSAVIKDFQVRHLLSVRKEARNVIELEVVPSMKSVDELKKKMRDIFYQHLERLHTLWNEDVSLNCRKRIEASFDALLPIETLNDVKKTLINITIEKTNLKLEHWRVSNISVEIFSKDISIDAVKLMENQQQQQQMANATTNKRTSQNMIIELSADYHPSDYFHRLQNYLHRANLHSNEMKTDEILKLLEMTEEILNKHTLPSNAYRNIAFYLLQLVLLLIANCPQLITKDLLAELFSVWHHEKLSSFTKLQRNECKDDESDEKSFCNRLKVNNFVFCNVISSRFMIMMNGRSRMNFQVYGNFLIELVREKFITVEDINELSVGLYKYEWSKNTLDDIAFLVQHVKSFLPSHSSSSSSSSHANAESHLFMELVADLARDMENF